MGSISLPTLAIIASVGAATSAGVAAYGAHEQGVAAANADKRKARVEADNERQKQISMRQNMLRALASQNAGALGAGVSRAGAMRQIDQAQNDLLVSKANSAAQVSLLDQAAGNAVATGNLTAAGDVVSGAAQYAGLGGTHGNG